jgi:hypothetical protein
MQEAVAGLAGVTAATVAPVEIEEALVRVVVTATVPRDDAPLARHRVFQAVSEALPAPQATAATPAA